MRNIFWLSVFVMTVSVCACGSPEQSSPKPAANKSAEKSTPVPDIVILDTSEGRITLPHLAHAKRFHCNTCHSEIIPGKIAWDKNTAHAYCRDCHQRNGKGPMACAECHKK
jgi:hypothetical protein